MVVNLNNGLGPLGPLSCAPDDGSEHHNAWLTDQLTALHRVRDNIAAYLEIVDAKDAGELRTLPWPRLVGATAGLLASLRLRQLRQVVPSIAGGGASGYRPVIVLRRSGAVARGPTALPSGRRGG
ncbi:hypothetical protein ACFYZ4_35280 [Streptomyces sp. NPDC001513]|uniref:hypothetical protein n=1 Tax=Streptomyces sp. NPDC001513 TaxID=3364580 RepID=UPI0036BF9D8F